MDTPATSLPKDFIETLTAILGNENILTDPAERWSYGYDNSRRQAMPSLVVFPHNAQQVQSIVQTCYQHAVAIIARGRGTGTTGATVPLNDEIIMSLERMDKIISVDPANRVMVVEPGVSNQQVQEAAAEHGFFWPPDPTSAAVCTIGGNLAYNSAGPRAVKYGTPRENVLGLRAITGKGDEIKTGVYTTKGVVGYDLTRLLIGSEGTLAVITEATLKLTPKQEAIRTIRILYRDIDSAARAVSAIMAQAVTPCALEFMDASAIKMIRDFSQHDIPADAGALLMVEIDGPQVAMDDQLTAIHTAASNEGLLEFSAAKNDADVKKLWEMRKALSPALRNIAPKKINEDIVVPVSHIPALINGLDSLATEFNITIVNFGHAGNGNIHVNLLIDPGDPQQMHSAEQCLDRVFDLVLSLNGTLSGEHGVGIEKRDFVSREIDPVTLDLMKKIKQQFDPKGILNPGKTLPV